MSDREPAGPTAKEEPSTTAKYGVKVKPATYDGVGAWADYKAHFEACAKLNGWDNDQKAMYLSVSLRGQTQGVYGNLASKDATYEDLVRALEERFAPPNQTELYRVQLKERQQRATETMAELGQDIRRLTNLAYPKAPQDVKETLAMEQFVDALVNSEMRLKIQQSRPVDLNDAVRHAVELESFYRAERRQQGMVRPTVTQPHSGTKEMDDMRNTIKCLQKTIDEMSKRPRSVYSDKRQGYRQPSQRTQTYPNSSRQNPPIAHLKCFICGSDQHLKRDCPQQRGSDNPKHNNMPSNVRKTSMISSAGMYATGQVDGRNVECLVDTGATLTLISCDLWDLIRDKHQLSSFETPLISASGNNLTVKGSTEIAIGFAGKFYPIRVVIAELDVDLVLGIDFMKNHQAMIDVNQDLLVLGKNKIDMHCIGKVGCYRVVLSERIVVPANSEVITTAKIADHGADSIKLGIVEPSERFVQL